eukprot:scaffold330_cov109-Isochrysis_galbana.AAC.8
MRLNSSKQPHAPVCASPEKMLAITFAFIWSEQFMTMTQMARPRPRPSRRASHDEAKRLCESDIAPIGESRDHEAARVADLALPGEGHGIVDLVINELFYDVAAVHIDRDERLDFDTHLLSEIAQHHVRPHGEPLHALLVVLLHGLLVALLEAFEGGVHLSGPPDLRSGDAQLRDVHGHPFFTRLLDVRVYALEEAPFERFLLVIHEAVQPVLDLAFAHKGALVGEHLLVDRDAALGQAYFLALLILLPGNATSGVREFGKVLLHRWRIAALGKDIDEIHSRDEVEARELLFLHLKIVGKRLLAEFQVVLALVEGLLATLGSADLNRVGVGDGIIHLLAELGVYLVEALRVLGQLLAYVLRAKEDGLE